MLPIPKNQFISATVQIVPNLMRPLAPAVIQKSKKIIQKEREPMTTHSLSKSILTGPVSVTSGIGVKTQVRFAHTDLTIPKRDFYRKDTSKDTTKSSEEGHLRSKSYSYVVLGGGFAMTGVYMAQKVVNNVMGSFSITADQAALGKTEVNLDEIPEGKSVTFKWRGKPLFIRHRSAKEVETETSVDLSTLRDPQHDQDRTQRPEWLVVIGVCTHLGCIPIHNAGNYGGFFCPCHGSHYDGSGRIRKGPAPLNLEVPFYSFNDNTLVVG